MFIFGLSPDFYMNTIIIPPTFIVFNMGNKHLEETELGFCAMCCLSWCESPKTWYSRYHDMKFEIKFLRNISIIMSIRIRNVICRILYIQNYI